MNRELTKREKTLLLILAILIIIIGYYKIVLEPINDDVSMYEGMTLQEETEIDAKNVQALRMSVMEKEIEKAKQNGVKKEVPRYDNSAALLPKLYAIMSAASDYSLDFQDLQTEGNVILRQMDIGFETKSFLQARKIIDKLYDMEYAFEIGDITMQKQSRSGSSSVTTNLNVTFFEVAKS